MREEWEKRFIDALTMLQIGFKKVHGRFPNVQENNKLIDEAESMTKGAKVQRGKAKNRI